MRRSSAVFLFFDIVLAVLFFAGVLILFRFGSCFAAAEKIPDFKGVVVARCMIYSSGSDSVSAVIRLYDNTGKELRTIERAWQKERIAIDFASCTFGDKTLLFPLEVSGVPLVPYYFDGTFNSGSCRLYRYPDAEKAVYTLAAYAIGREHNPLFFFFPDGFHRSRISVPLSGCAVGVEYALTVDSVGKITLSR